MRAAKDNKAETTKKKLRRVLKWGFVFAIVFFLLVVLLLPVFLSSAMGREIVLARINDTINGQADFSALSAGWLKGIKVTDFSFNDNLGRTSVQVKQIATRPHYVSILTGNLSFGETIIDQPRIHINLEDRREETVLRAEEPQLVPVKHKSIALVMDVAINNGNLRVTGSKGQSVELSRINSKLNLRPPPEQTSFDVDMAVGEQEKRAAVSAAGRIKPGPVKTGWTFKGTTGDLTVEVDDLDLASLGPIFELAGVELEAKGRLSADLKSEVKDGRFEKLAATLEAENLDVTGTLLKGDRLRSGRFSIDVELTGQKQFVNVQNLQVDSDWFAARASGIAPTTFRSLAEFLTSGSDYSLSGTFDVDVEEVLSQMPHTFRVKEGMKVTSGKLSGNIEASSGKLSGQANLVDLAGTVDGKKLALSEPVISRVLLTAEQDDIHLDKVDVSAAFAKIEATGSLEQVEYDGQVDLAKLQSELGQFISIGPYEMAGELWSKGQVSIKEDVIKAVGSSQVKNLRFSSVERVSASEPNANIAFAFAIDKTRNIVAVDSVEATTSLGAVSIKEAVVPLGGKATKPMELSVSASEVNLQGLQPFAVLFASLPKDMQLAGTAESRVAVTSSKGIYRIQTDATRIKNFKLVSPGREPFQQGEVLFVFDAQVDPKQKAITVKELRLESPQIKIKKGEFKKSTESGKTRVQGQLDCEYDWSAISRVASAFLPQGLELQGQRETTVDFSSHYPHDEADKLLANLDTKTVLGFEKARYLGLNFGPTEVDIQVQKGLLKMAPFTTTVNKGRLSFAGEADFKQKPTILRTPGPIQIAKDVQINKETTEKLLMYVNPIFANVVNVSGVANFDCQRLAIPLAGAGKKDIEIAGTISMQKLHLQASDLLGQILSVAGTALRGQEMTIRPTKFILQDGFLRYDDMQVDVGDNPVNFKGVIGLDKSLNMTVTLPYTLQGRTVRVDRESAGERISLPLKGTVDKPELDVGRLLEDQLRRRLEDQLRRGLEELFK